MIHLSDGSSPVSLDVPYAPADIPVVLRTAREVLASNDGTAHPLDVLGAEQRITGMVELAAYRIVIGAAEVALSTLLNEVNLQQGGVYEEIEGVRVFTDAPSQLVEQVLREAVWQRMFGESGLAG